MTKVNIFMVGIMLLHCWVAISEAKYLKYKDPKQHLNVRIKLLIDRMTLEKKIGSVLSGAGSVPKPQASAEDWMNMVNDLQKGSLSTRLGIPMIYRIDVIHGNNNVYNATIFPHNVGLGATRDPKLVRRIGAATALEVRATGIQYAFAPCIAVCRDPRWGRCYESYSEDHKVVQAMTEIIPGLRKVIASAKHYVGDGGTIKGINENNTVISKHGLLSIHMPAYYNVIIKGVSTIMVMVPLNYTEFIDGLTSLVESNAIPMSRIDDAIRRILRVKFVMGLFENPLADHNLVHHLGKKKHRELAREVVRKSLVLLKNGENPNQPILPLPKKASKILVAGSHADNLGYQCTTILNAIKNTIDKDTEVVYKDNPDLDYVKSNNFSYVIVVVGEQPYAKTNEPYVDKIDALVAAWLPSTEGNGVTDVLFGDYGFRGKLPRTWFKSVDQLPMNVGDSHYDPIFPFGFGLKTKHHKVN
ncbi:uncharacterized protein HKW66_Vig0149900 [Vigna angularis]|uniref:Glycoside hydrolase family 3 N-terminal domain-containing protein n=1 Tax=Phaseolus angularis TaxID=3914 RepID=A0A8T0JVL6_PHAAN|nr:uncharacterized protein HKW66_Vig0149900 [Vigna angularis]